MDWRTPLPSSFESEGLCSFAQLRPMDLGPLGYGPLLIKAHIGFTLLFPFSKKEKNHLFYQCLYILGNLQFE